MVAVMMKFFLSPVHGRHDDGSDGLAPGIGNHDEEGARLSKLLVTMIIMAPDGGKWS